MRKKLIAGIMTAMMLAAIPFSQSEIGPVTAYAETLPTTGVQDTEAGADMSDMTAIPAAKANKIQVTVSKTRLKNFQKGTKKSLKLYTDMGSITLDKKLAKSLVNKAKGKKISIIMEQVELTQEQKRIYGDEAAGWKISFRSAGKTILNPDSSGASAVFYMDKNENNVSTDEISLCRMITGGKIYCNTFSLSEEEKASGTKLACKVKGSLQGTFIVGDKAEMETARLISGVQNTRIKAKVTAAEKAQSGRLSYVGLNWTKSKGFKLDGYEIHHSFDGIVYQKAHTLEGNECYNHNVASGTTKYYKIRGYRTIDNHIYYTRWSNVVSGSV